MELTQKLQVWMQQERMQKASEIWIRLQRAVQLVFG